MSDVVERFRVELAKFDDDDIGAEGAGQGAAALRALFESEVVPHVRELEQRALDEAWDIVEAAMGSPEGESDVDTARRAAELIRVVVREQGSEDPVTALREGLLEARAVARVVVEALGLPADVELPVVVARARELRSDLDQAREVLRRQHDALQEVARICAQRPVTANVMPEAVVARVRAVVEGPQIQLGADGGLDLDLADRSMLRAVGEGWVREVGEHGALRWQPPGAGAEPFGSAEWARFEWLRDAGLVSTEDAEHPYLTEQGCHELGRDAAPPRGAVRYRTSTAAGAGLSPPHHVPTIYLDGAAARALQEITWHVFEPNPDAVRVDPSRWVDPYPHEVVARVRRITEALLEVAALPGIEVAQGAVRGDPEAVLSVVRTALAELHEVREVREPLREGLAPAPDVVVTARVMELLRAADDLHRLAVGGPGWSRVVRERTWVAAWLTRRAREIVDVPVEGPAGGLGE